MSWAHNTYRDLFFDMDKTLKQVDLSAILSVLLGTAFPFSNLGVFHPLFAQTGDIKEVHDLFIKNLE